MQLATDALFKKRVLVTVFTLALLTVDMLPTWWLVLTKTEHSTLACRLIPNAEIPMAPSIASQCPLEPFDRITKIQDSQGKWLPVQSDIQIRDIAKDLDNNLHAEVLRGSTTLRVDIPIDQTSRIEISHFVIGATITALFLWLCGFLIIWTSTHPAAFSMMLYYTAAGIYNFWILCGSLSAPGLFFATAIAGGLIPSTVIHMTLTLPRQSDLMKQRPQIILWSYIICMGLASFVAVFSRLSQTTTSLLYQAATVTSIITTVILFLTCLHTAYFAKEALVRNRARVLAIGFFFAICVSGLSFYKMGEFSPRTSYTIVSMSFLTGPTFVGYAIARYQLFGVPLSISRIFGFAFYVTIVAGFFSFLSNVLFNFGIEMPPSSYVFVIACLFIAVIDPVRWTIRRFFASWVSPKQQPTVSGAPESRSVIENQFSPLTLEDPLAEIETLAARLNQSLDNPDRLAEDAQELAKRTAELRIKMRKAIHSSKPNSDESSE